MGGTMDASAFVAKKDWEEMMFRNQMDEVDIRDNRYNQVVHMVTAATGAEEYYSVEHHATRLETLDEARERDRLAAEAWIGHPYVDIIDNGSDFETKINRLISCVALKIGVDIGDRLSVNAKKIKVAINGPLPKDSAFPNFRDFEVTHNYLQTASRTMQSRLRKRGRLGKFSYIHTIRKQVRPDHRGQDADQPQGVLPPPRPAGLGPLHRQQDQAVLHVQQPVLPAGHLQGALSPPL